jgi:hypothetical protein
MFPEVPEPIGELINSGPDLVLASQQNLKATFIDGLPTLDNLRNFLLTTTTEVLSFFQQVREAP